MVILPQQQKTRVGNMLIDEQTTGGGDGGWMEAEGNQGFLLVLTESMYAYVHR